MLMLTKNTQETRVAAETCTLLSSQQDARRTGRMGGGAATGRERFGIFSHYKDHLCESECHLAR